MAAMQALLRHALPEPEHQTALCFVLQVQVQGTRSCWPRSHTRTRTSLQQTAHETAWAGVRSAQARCSRCALLLAA